jgi:hypothetical protein
MKKIIGLALFVSFFTLTTFAAEAAAPSVLLNYSYYHYDLSGQSTANTNIYKFGASTVDLNLMSATWLYSADWTFVAILPYINNRVETVYEPVPGGINYATSDVTGGLSDLRFMALTPFSLNPEHMTFVDAGFTLPTGSIDKYFTSSPTQRAAYNMQMGSGTPDLIVGATVTNTTLLQSLVTSARGQLTVRGGRNSNGYGLGNEFQAKLSSLYTINSYFIAGAVGNYRVRGAVNGRDEKYELFNNYVSTAASGDGHQFYHAPQVNWDTSIIAKVQTLTTNKVSASLEAGLPFAQGLVNKDDIKLNLNYYVAAALNSSF